jgi:hypothetical protein
MSRRPSSAAICSAVEPSLFRPATPIPLLSACFSSSTLPFFAISNTFVRILRPGGAEEEDEDEDPFFDALPRRCFCTSLPLRRPTVNLRIFFLSIFKREFLKLDHFGKVNREIDHLTTNCYELVIINNVNLTCGTINANRLSGANAFGGVFALHDGWDVAFAGDDGGVAEQAPVFNDDGGDH